MKTTLIIPMLNMFIQCVNIINCSFTISKPTLTRNIRSCIHFSAVITGRGRVSTAVTNQKLDEPKTKITNVCNERGELLSKNPSKGTRDFYPEDMRLRKWLFDHWHAVANTYGFSQYDAPILEQKCLFTRKEGEDVSQQLYDFKDKGNRSVSLRPEMTPSLARMVLARKGRLSFPLKWYSIPQCWRYERMGKGRRREHFQWNIDIWGVNDVQAEAELLDILVTFFKGVGLTSNDVGIRVNSRPIICEVLNNFSIPKEKFMATCILIDKLERSSLNEIQEEFVNLGINVSVVEELILTITNKSIDDITEFLGSDSKAVQQLKYLVALCRAYGINDWIKFDASIIRGLSYYTGIVFEAFDKKGKFRAIAGGGRYDELLESFGGDPTPAVGFAVGDVVIVELLKELNILPTFENSEIDIVVFAMCSELYEATINVATRLRESGKRVDLVLQYRRVKWCFKYASKVGCKYIVMVAPEEYVNGEVVIRKMQTSNQTKIKINDLSQWVN